MANKKKPKENKFEQLSFHTDLTMRNTLNSIADENGIARNELIRIACNYLIKNTKQVFKWLK